MKPIKLGRTERIIAVVPAYHSGPGWANQLVDVLIEDRANGSIRHVYLQPNEQPPFLQIMLPAGAAMHKALCDTIKTKQEQ